MTANQIWWIALTLLFVWMMWRGGCGMAMRRSRTGGARAKRGDIGSAVDPVCRMAIDPSKAVGTRVREGETYFFCSQTCADAFDSNPAMYAHQRDAHEHRHHGC